MTLGELLSKPLNDQLADMELVEMKPHTSENGNIQCVELKYVPKSEIDRKNAEREEKKTRRY